jgi:hypothetical protein
MSQTHKLLEFRRLLVKPATCNIMEKELSSEVMH